MSTESKSPPTTSSTTSPVKETNVKRDQILHDNKYIFQVTPEGKWNRIDISMVKRGDSILTILQKAVGGNIELVPATESADEERFLIYCHEEGFIKNDMMNDLGAHVIEILGFNICAFVPLGVRGSIVITNGEEGPLPEKDLLELESLCTKLTRANLEDDEDEEEGENLAR